MRMFDIIKKKRDGEKLTEEEIRFFVNGYSNGEIPDYQVSALCMAIYINGMDIDETTQLTLAVRDSGDILSFKNIKGIRVDKHSTGGVGDKTSLVVAPVCAALGVKIAKMSGRGLGHTGGTIDKLESIRGLRTDLSTEEFEKIVNETGIAIAGQSKTLAPADKKLYALRDVTATIDSMPLIASSIMGKKLAADDDCIVLDVKTGSGSFMKTIENSKELARIMVDIGKKAGKKTVALITDMDRPLGKAIGNSLEVIEAIETLKGNGPEDLSELCTILAGYMLSLEGKGSEKECELSVKEAISSGKALDKLAQMVKAQGGDSDWIYDTEKFPKALYKHDVISIKEGYIHSVNTEDYGVASVLLGAGRNLITDTIDASAGIILEKRNGDYVKKGEVIATLYTSTRENMFAQSEKKLLDATVISAEKPESRDVVLSVVE